METRPDVLSLHYDLLAVPPVAGLEVLELQTAYRGLYGAPLI